jgi:hypothetical protein
MSERISTTAGLMVTVGLALLLSGLISMRVKAAPSKNSRAAAVLSTTVSTKHHRNYRYHHPAVNATIFVLECRVSRKAVTKEQRRNNVIERAKKERTRTEKERIRAEQEIASNAQAREEVKRREKNTRENAEKEEREKREQSKLEQRTKRKVQKKEKREQEQQTQRGKRGQAAQDMTRTPAMFPPPPHEAAPPPKFDIVQQLVDVAPPSYAAAIAEVEGAEAFPPPHAPDSPNLTQVRQLALPNSQGLDLHHNALPRCFIIWV